MIAGRCRRQLAGTLCLSVDREGVIAGKPDTLGRVQRCAVTEDQTNVAGDAQAVRKGDAPIDHIPAFAQGRAAGSNIIEFRDSLLDAVFIQIGNTTTCKHHHVNIFSCSII